MVTEYIYSFPGGDDKGVVVTRVYSFPGGDNESFVATEYILFRVEAEKALW